MWLLVGLVAAAASPRHAVGIDRAFFSGRRGTRGRRSRAGAGDRRPLRHVRRPGEPREAERAHDRANVVVLPALSKPARKDAVTYLAGGPGDAATEQALNQGWQSSALNMYRDILLVDQRGTGRSNPGRRRRDPVRDADGDGRPRRGARGARLPAARRDRQLLRRHRGAGLPEAPSLLGAHARPLGRDRDRRPLLRPLRRQRPARPRPAREALRLGSRLPEGVPALGAPVRRAREGVERPPGERHDGRRARLRRPRDAARPGGRGLDPARRQPRRRGRLRAPRARRARGIPTST